MYMYILNIVILESCSILIDSLLFGEGGGGRCLKLDVQGQGGGRFSDVGGQGGWGVLKIGQFSWTSYVYRPLYDI